MPTQKAANTPPKKRVIDRLVGLLSPRSKEEVKERSKAPPGSQEGGALEIDTTAGGAGRGGSKASNSVYISPNLNMDHADRAASQVGASVQDGRYAAGGQKGDVEARRGYDHDPLSETRIGTRASPAKDGGPLATDADPMVSERQKSLRLEEQKLVTEMVLRRKEQQQQDRARAREEYQRRVELERQAEEKVGPRRNSGGAASPGRCL